MYKPDSEDPPNLTLIRWRMVYFKASKLLGSFTNMEKKPRLNLVNTIMQTYLWGVAPSRQKDLTNVDKNNLDDMIIIVIELLHEIKEFD